MPLRFVARLATCLALSSVCTSALADEPLTITARPLAVFDSSVPDNRFGPLTFLGGLVLRSANANMQALSGLTMRGDQLLMVTDEGYWVVAQLEASADGAPTGLSQAHIGPLLNREGAPMLSKRFADAEAATVVGDTLWVSSERSQPIRAYALEQGRPVGAAQLPIGQDEPLPGGRNSGIEAMVHVQTGQLAGQTIIFLEEPPRQASLNAPAPTAARITSDGDVLPFAVRREDNFAITGAAALPSGDIVVVERRFGWQSGLFMRLRFLPASQIAAGAVQGRLMLHADAGTAIDNMEGIAVSDHPDGPILTLISDDNGNFFQRTILLRFQITGDLESLSVPTLPPPTPRPDLRPDL